MKPVFEIQSAGNNETGIIMMNLFSFITLFIGGIIIEGEHLHVGLRVGKYEVAFQLHNHKTDKNQITIIKTEGE